jgi:hypothetical protein
MARFVNAGEGTPKPDYCLTSCVLGNKSNGFVSDHYGSDPKIAFISAMPTESDCFNGKPMSSYKGAFYYNVLKPYGLTWDNVILTHCIRCNYWSRGTPYPKDRERSLAERACRSYDALSRDALGLPNVARGLATWNPNLFVVAYGFNDAQSLEAYQALMINDIAKAMRFQAKGFRPLLVQGKEALAMLAPWAPAGGMKVNRGDWWEGSLPYTATSPGMVTLERNLVPVETLMKSGLPPKKGAKPLQGNLFE